jgi:hypothetical protein
MRPLFRVLACLAFASLSGAASAQSSGATPAKPAPVVQPVPAGMTCPGDKLVWVTPRSHVYRFEGEHLFGATKNGRYMCQHDADKAGDHALKVGKKAAAHS